MKNNKIKEEGVNTKELCTCGHTRVTHNDFYKECFSSECFHRRTGISACKRFTWDGVDI